VLVACYGRSIVRWLGRIVSGVALVALGARPTAAAEPVEQCINGFESAQVERDQGRLNRARELLTLCAQEVCPAVIRQDCREWLFDIEQRIPSVVLRARTADGPDLAEVRVYADGELLTDRLDGRPLRLDPGARRLLWEYPGYESVVTDIIVREGEKNRFVSATFSKRDSAGGADTEGPRDTGVVGAIPSAAWVAGGVGAVGLGTFIVLGLSVESREGDMQSSCAPNCSADRVHKLERDALLANVAFGVGMVGLAVATWITLSPGEPSPPAAASVDIQATPGGATAVVSGRF
jgi:hypothetical protein